MLNTALIIKNADELTVSTRTNTPSKKAPEEYQSAITKAATEYINRYLCHYMENDMVGIASVLPIVRNRFENLTVEGIFDGTIKTASDVHTLLSSNGMLQPMEERAIISAYRNDIAEASLYIQIFFSYKVHYFMQITKMHFRSNAADIYAALQLYLYQLADDFDFDVIKNGGLCTEYYMPRMHSYYREEIVGKQTSMLTHHARQTYEMNVIRKHVSDEDFQTLSLAEIAKKYNIHKPSLMLYLSTSRCVYLDHPAKVDGELTLPYEVAASTDHDIHDVETSVDIEYMIVDLEHRNIQRSTTVAILSAIIAYTYTKEAYTQRGRMRKMSERVYKNIADNVGVQPHVVKAVINGLIDTLA